MLIRTDSGSECGWVVPRNTTLKGYAIKERPWVKRVSILFSPVTRSSFKKRKHSPSFIDKSIPPKAITPAKIIVFGIKCAFLEKKVKFDRIENNYLRPKSAGISPH